MIVKNIIGGGLRVSVDDIAIGEGGKPGEYHYFATWSHPRDGAFAELWNISIGARTEAANFIDRRATILASDRLSDAAKKDDEKALAKSVLESLGQLQRRLNAADARHDAERKQLAAVAPADTTTMILDLELARMFRELHGDARSQMMGRLVGGKHPEIIGALMRLPPLLFPMEHDTRTAIVSAEIGRRAPDQVYRLQQLHQATETTQTVISRVVKLIEGHSGLTLQERMVSLGKDAWEPHVREGGRDAMGALAQRYGVS